MHVFVYLGITVSMSNKIVRCPYFVRAQETNSLGQIRTIFQINSQIRTDIRALTDSELEVSLHPGAVVTGKHNQGFTWVSSVNAKIPCCTACFTCSPLDVNMKISA
jgi:hypothetical protein